MSNENVNTIFTTADLFYCIATKAQTVQLMAFLLFESL